MKKQFEMPVVNIDMFSTENLITTSGVAATDNAVAMAKQMEDAGYKATTVSLKDKNFTFSL